jgi:hypothetical protein
MASLFKSKHVFFLLMLLVFSVSTVSATTASTSYFYPPDISTIDFNVASREAALQSRSTNFYNTIATMTAANAMAYLTNGGNGFEGSNGLLVNGTGATVETLGCTNSTYCFTVNPITSQPIVYTSAQRKGAAQYLQISLTHPTLLSPANVAAAIAAVIEDIDVRIYQYNLWFAASTAGGCSGGGQDGSGGVKERQERGDIAYEAWLLNQAGAYFSAAPGLASSTSVQGVFETFTMKYVESIAATIVDYCNTENGWLTTGYNKEVAVGIHPAYAIGIYTEPVAQTFFPNTYTGFFNFWDHLFRYCSSNCTTSSPTMVLGSYETDNSPGYNNLNVNMVLFMGIALNRSVRAGSTSIHAYINDSEDMPRLLNNMAQEIMSNGNYVNYNRGIFSWRNNEYAYNSPEVTGPTNLQLGYLIYQNPNYLYYARKLEQFMITTGQLNATILNENELWPANLDSFNVTGVPAPTPVSQMTLFRTSYVPPYNSNYHGQFLDRGAPASQTTLVPEKFVLRTGVDDYAPYLMMSINGFGHHGFLDQSLTLENTLFDGSYQAGRPGQAIQVNQSNAVFIAPTSQTYPMFVPYSSNTTDEKNDNISFYNTLYTALGYNNPYTTGITNYIYGILSGGTNIQPNFNASASQLSNGSGYSDITFSEYQYPGYDVRRQTILMPNGIIAVKDTVWSDGTNTALTANGGVTWRLWPGVSASGTNWALQSPLTSISSSALIPATTQTTQTLFYISEATGRNFGTQSEPLTDYISSAASQTVQTFYAYENVSDLKQHVFVTLIMPLLDPTGVSTIVAGIQIQPQASGQLLVIIPDVGCNTVQVTFPA